MEISMELLEMIAIISNKSLMLLEMIAIISLINVISNAINY